MIESTENLYIAEQANPKHEFERFRILSKIGDKFAGGGATLEEAVEKMNEREQKLFGPKAGRKSPSQRAYARGRSYGVNGQIWDEDI